MKISGYATLCYSLLMMLGGLMGFIMAKSLMSLLSGLFFGFLLLAYSIRMLRGDKRGFKLAFFQILFLAGFFFYRFRLTGKFMPAGIVLTLSITLLALLLILWPREKSAHE